MLCSYPGNFLCTIYPAYLLSDTHISQFSLYCQVPHSFRTRSTANRGSTQWATKHSLHRIQKWIHDLQSAELVVTDITKNCTSFLLISGQYGSPLLLLITPYMFLLFPSLIQQNILIFFLFFLFSTGLPLRSLTRKNAWLSLLQQELLSILLRVKKT